ncbi:NAD-dependent epimerase/dehydratase family protein [Tenacibaculum jejuense]|uniref:NAD-dependent epimerase/dehydratase n=1 Tax=Tenacibaculum jejuense TaxID=584609 RepID=A0A238U776_9FLAO|nr:NAD-dependent epimerase/dehydratase family protein [Tenacibaculum jejuense]SNR14905.1 NAD-dependent epimerase/dehydratase [Tenacibaculum jejuense]
MRNVMVTGASGYVGKNFIESYSSNYNLFTFSLLKNSIESLELQNIDVILHCAALVHKSKVKNAEYKKVNVNYPYNLAKKAKSQGVKQFVFISSIAIYGNKSLINYKTEKKPNNEYGLSKLQAEELLESLNDETFVVSIVRPPMVYGKNAPGNINRLLSLIKRTPILPFKGIKNKRNFVYIQNLLQGINHIIENKIEGDFLICDDESISTTDLIINLSKVINKRVILIRIPFFNFVLRTFKPILYDKLYSDLIIDNTKTNNILKYKTPYSLFDGLKSISKIK